MHKQHADEYQRHAANAAEVDLFHGQADQSEMVNQQRGQHLPCNHVDNKTGRPHTRRQQQGSSDVSDK
ncbi:hypothetical protein AXE65_12405 [Ventosimonas gracilis]|uniref:Uncharacterized protein n=1 Tax=Ventosimonas gracilis TaxID=1680762 RepID=A0A139SVS0_9GAMM|nr:hypothetical protein AXE65_12405 [Ventosimonas gracilis]